VPPGMSWSACGRTKCECGGGTWRRISTAASAVTAA